LEHCACPSLLHDYAAPEEARSQAPDDRSDIYSVGAILYEMLTMRRPMHRGAAAPSASNMDVTKELDTAVLTAGAPHPDLRYQSVLALAGDLRSIASALEIEEERVVQRDQPPASVDVGRVGLIT